MSAAHAFLAPSAAGRWVKCALAPTLEAAYPDAEDSPAGLEGTAAHWVVQMLLQGTPAVHGDLAPNGVAVTDEMLEGAEMVRDDIADKLGPDWATRIVVERRLDIRRVHVSVNWGTPDYYAQGLHKGRPCLYIWDYKFGHGIVEAAENWQLTNYAAGCLDEWGIDGIRDRETVVDFGIIQPRAHHREGSVRHWRTMASDLRAAINVLTNAAHVACSPNPPATPDPDACQYCAGRHACEALQRAAYQAADRAQQLGALELSAHALGAEAKILHRAQALLAARVSGLDAEIEGRIRRGESVPFWRVESAPGRLAWTKPAAEVVAFGHMIGLELTKAPDVVTPTQAKALAKKAALPAELFDAFADQPSGAAKLIFDDGSKARLTFSSSVA